MAAVKHDIETTYINVWAETGFSLIVRSETVRQMDQMSIDLVDINHVLKTGLVTHSDMFDSRGLWTVRGTTVDDICVELKIAVESSRYEVEVLQILEVKRS